jgi:hypothetical protein
MSYRYVRNLHFQTFITLHQRTQQYRRRDPIDADETEFMENVFDVLCSALSSPTIKHLFLAAEGPDLMVLMMKFVLPLILICRSMTCLQREVTVSVTLHQNIGFCHVGTIRHGYERSLY